jgi:GT2 family glycosyltransferase
MEEIDLCWRISNANSKYEKKYIFNSKVFHLGGGSLNYNNPKKIYYNIRNHKSMICKNVNRKMDKFLISLNVFLINILISFYFLITLKFKHFLMVYEAIFYSHPKSNINSKFKITKPKNKLKYYHVKSILLEYLILNKKRFTELNKS